MTLNLTHLLEKSRTGVEPVGFIEKQFLVAWKRSAGMQGPTMDSIADAKSLQLAITTTYFVSAPVITDSCVAAMLIFYLERLYRISFVLTLNPPLPMH